MTNIIPLPVYPHKPTGADLEAIRKAKAMIDTDVLIKPVKALPRSPGRVLALREKPNFACDFALISDTRPQILKPALEWVLGLNEEYEGHSVITMLREIFGESVKEIKTP